MTDIFKSKWLKTVPLNYWEIGAGDDMSAEKFYEKSNKNILEHRIYFTAQVMGYDDDISFYDLAEKLTEFYNANIEEYNQKYNSINDISNFEPRFDIISDYTQLIDMIDRLGIYSMSSSKDKTIFMDKFPDIIGDGNLKLVIPAFMYLINMKRQNKSFVYKMQPKTINGYEYGKFLGGGMYGFVRMVSKNGVEYADKTVREKIDINELNILASFDHPNMNSLHDFFYDKSGKAHIILALADETLADVLYRRVKPSKETIYMWMYQIASALDFFHKQGYYHCDIKDENILIKNGSAILADFGLSFPFGTNMDFCGTPTWTAPEGLKEKTANFSNQKINHRSADIYALGLIFYYMITADRAIELDPVDDENGDQDVDENLLMDQAYNKFTSNYREIIDSRIADKSLANLIKKMCNPIIEERIRSLDEVFNSDFFTNLNYQTPISGLIKRPESIGRLSSEKTEILERELTEITKLGDMNILAVYLIVSIYRRVSDDFQSHEYASVIHTIAWIVSELLYTVQPDQDPDQDHVRKILVALKGLVRPVTLYDFAVSYEEACFGLVKLIYSPYKNVDDYIHQLELSHMKYLKCETPDMIVSRKSKHTTMFTSLTDADINRYLGV